MASVASQLIEEVTAHAQSEVWRMRERYAQTVLTFRITYVDCFIAEKYFLKGGGDKNAPVFVTNIHSTSYTAAHSST